MQFLKVALFCGLAAAIAVPDPIKSYHEIAARSPQGDIADHKAYCAGNPSAPQCSHDVNVAIIQEYCKTHHSDPNC
ncbi:hypothetical protein HII31_00310 [Pseudocercospora fuligena]|uniref:Uncharacterized protein n=1 Tax=Pseudocercospora fuligena TaxID=685502 RepID=A0A8H6RUC7_9PEZI|nr:hypothetical protein HII31_00310 [Pseudocercospora fuligena]